ncbi:MAG: 4Fe-4S binding protein [Candidatus Desantisbacteria bacterium]
MKRNIIRIDEEKCNGCRLCVSACAERAIEIVDGKARLTVEKYCDGLGACLGECPQGAIIIEEREVEAFDKKAANLHLHSQPCGCPSAKAMSWKVDVTGSSQSVIASSMLSQWPVKLALVSPGASYFDGADLIVTADCVPFAYANFHQDFLKGKAVVIGCPKLDDQVLYLQRLTGIFRQSNLRSIVVIHMEVPCCFGLQHMVETALAQSGKNILLSQIVIGINGERK